jgi:hypothetical protein
MGGEEKGVRQRCGTLLSRRDGAGRGVVCGRCHVAARSGEGRGGQRGGRAARCGWQWPGSDAHGRRACRRRATGAETGEAGDFQVGPSTVTGGGI